jgi:hypothetical protein
MLNLSSFSGGTETNSLLKNLGFDVSSENTSQPEKTRENSVPRGFKENPSFKIVKNVSSDNPIFNIFLKFEYLLNLAKIQYLIDCFEKDLDARAISQFICTTNPEKISQAKILHSHFGRMFVIYLNNPIYAGGEKGKESLGPLIKDYEPKKTPLFSELYATNNTIKEFIIHSDNWFPFLCEYFTLKTAIHELLVDASDHLYDWGYRDLVNLLKYSQQDKIFKKDLRESVLHMMHLGINPCISPAGYNNDISNLKDLDYPSFMQRRNEWINCAHYAIDIIKRKMKNERIPLQWDTYSMCAFDCGPVFLQKRKGLVFPRICEAITSYNNWDAPLLIHEKMQQIFEKDIDIFIGRYWDYFGPNNDTVEFFQTQKERVLDLYLIKNRLDEKYHSLKNTL